MSSSTEQMSHLFVVNTDIDFQQPVQLRQHRSPINSPKMLNRDRWATKTALSDLAEVEAGHRKRESQKESNQGINQCLEVD